MSCEPKNGTDYESRKKIYLDVCCLNRPFDDQSQDRIRLEAEAVLLILTRAQNEDWVWCSSDVVIDEIEQTPDTKRRERVMQLNAHANEIYQLTEGPLPGPKHSPIAAFQVWMHNIWPVPKAVASTSF